MATGTKRILSGSTDGGPISIAQIATAGDLIHTAVAGVVDFDEVWVWMSNNHSADVEIEVEWDNATAVENIVQTISFDGGLQLVVPGLLLQNAGEVRVFAGTTAVVAVFGYVNRITA